MAERTTSRVEGFVGMTGTNPKDQGPNQRVCNRLKLPRTLLLELEHGQVVEGRTVDISPRGALMTTKTPPEGNLLGKVGNLFIISDEGHFSIAYPCKVVRQEDCAVAMEIHKKAAAAFGDYMTSELLKRPQTKSSS